MTMRIEDHKKQSEGTKRKFTIIVGAWSSQCGYCGQDVLPSEKTHTKVSGYGGDTEGCNVEFRYISTFQSLGVDLPKHMEREDLKEINITELSEEEV